MAPYDVNGRTVLTTGAARGIGAGPRYVGPALAEALRLADPATGGDRVEDELLGAAASAGGA